MLFLSEPNGKSLSAADRGDVGVFDVWVAKRAKGDVGGLFVGLKVAPGEAGVGLFKLALFCVFRELKEKNARNCLTLSIIPSMEFHNSNILSSFTIHISFLGESQPEGQIITAMIPGYGLKRDNTRT